jgi:dihydropteroate synthase
MKKFKTRVLSVEQSKLKQEILTQINPTEIGATKIANKGKYFYILIENVKTVVANVIKQEMLSIGADAAVAKGALDLSVDRCNVLLVGNLKQYKQLAIKIKAQPFSLKYLGKEVLELIENFNKDNFLLNSKNRTIELENKTYIMGILNVTPDSFSDGGDFTNKDNALRRTEEMLEQGADFIDIGGESTRPGAKKISIDEELKRVIPVIESVKKNFPDSIVSIDTYKSKIAKEAIDNGADIINDISGLKFDSEMAQLVAKENVPVIIMHIKGTPEDMQKNPVYSNLLNEISDYFRESLLTLEKAGGNIKNVIIDPGIGFGKTFDHNLTILNRLKEFKSFGCPILIGASRKSFIGAILNKKNAKNRLFGSIAVAVQAAFNGAKILRVHDVKETLEALKVADSIMNEKVG